MMPLEVGVRPDERARAAARWRLVLALPLVALLLACAGSSRPIPLAAHVDLEIDAKVRHYTVRDTIVPGSNNARWRVHLFWPVSLPFLVLYTDPAVLTHSDHR